MKSKVIKKVLVCRPTYFTVHYVINPWMKPGTADSEKAKVQWNTLIETYKNLDIETEIVDQEREWPDMVFSADQAIISGKKALLSNFKYKERSGESHVYEKWLQDHGYMLQRLPSTYFFEGNGEVLPWRDILLMSTGFRTSIEALAHVSAFTGKEVIPLELINKQFYHLDTCLFPLNDEVIFYYPKAFSKDSLKRLAFLDATLIPFTDEEAKGFCANSVVTDSTVLYTKGNATFGKKLKELGYKSVELDVSEFIKSGGGIHCLTNVLEETYE